MINCLQFIVERVGIKKMTADKTVKSIVKFSCTHYNKANLRDLKAATGL